MYGSSKKINLPKRQSYRSKALKLIIDAPWYVSNKTHYTDLQKYNNRLIKDLADMKTATEKELDGGPPWIKNREMPLVLSTVFADRCGHIFKI